MKTIEDWKKELLANEDVDKLLAVNTTEDVQGNRRRFVALYSVIGPKLEYPAFATLEIEEANFCIVKYEYQGFMTREDANSYLWKRTEAEFEDIK